MIERCICLGEGHGASGCDRARSNSTRTVRRLGIDGWSSTTTSGNHRNASSIGKMLSSTFDNYGIDAGVLLRPRYADRASF